MTPAELRDLAESELYVPLLTAFEATGYSETAGRQAHRAGQLPFRVYGSAKAFRVPVVDLVALLLDAPDMDEAVPDRTALATTTSPTEARSDQSASLSIA